MSFILIFILFLIFFPFGPVKAYLDPGIGGMFVQLLAAGLAGILIILKIFWRKILIFGRKERKTIKNMEKKSEKNEPAA